MENSLTKTAKKRQAQVVKPENRIKTVTEEDIRQKAFEIYLNNGGNSNELDNWLRAERELKESSR